MVDLYQSFFAIAGVGAVIVAVLFGKINQEKVSNEKAEKIASAILKGAMTFLREEYKVITLMVVLICEFIMIQTYSLGN